MYKTVALSLRWLEVSSFVFTNFKLPLLIVLIYLTSITAAIFYILTLGPACPVLP